MKKLFLLIIILVGIAKIGFSQAGKIQRPKIWGIAKMTFLVSDFQIARDYYGDFLGFEEAFAYPSYLGEVISFKVNDRQFLEFIEDREAKNKPRLVSVSFETGEVENMRRYLQQKGIEAPPEISVDGAGNEVILINDFSGVPIEFINFKANSLHRLSKGKYLSVNRISKRIHHAGLYCKEVVDNDPFYVGILGFREIWRFPENPKEKVEMNYFQIPDCVENIEFYTSNNINFNHPCFLVEDMQETIYTLKERKGKNHLSKPAVGKGNRWLLNLKNTDGTKVEFTEAHTIR